MGVELRPWKEEDAADVAHFANNKKIAANLRNVFPHPYTEQDAKSYVSACVEHEGKRQICNEAFTSFDIVRIYAEPFAYNIGSRRVLEKAGFVLEGVMKNGAFKNGKLVDYCMYALLKAETI